MKNDPLDKTHWILDQETFNEFKAILDRPAKANERLTALLSRKPLWKTEETS